MTFKHYVNCIDKRSNVFMNNPPTKEGENKRKSWKILIFGGIIMTYLEAKKQGYKDGRQSYQRGYVSRRVNTNDQSVLISGRGEMYVLLPCWTSTQYCIRQYLYK